MHKIQRLIASTLFVSPLLWTPSSLLAQSPFNGTWQINLDESRLPTKPTTFSLADGMYDCSSCAPNVHLKADGQDHAVSGQYFDAESVREVDPKTIAITLKKNGKIIEESTRTVSNDGNTLTIRMTQHLPNSDKPVTGEAAFTRVGKAPAGAHGASGSWQIKKAQESANARTATFKLVGDELSFNSTGESFTAKLDGKDHPVKGSLTYDVVSLKSIDDRTIEWTSKRDGKVVGVEKLTVAPDGKKMTIFETNKLTGATETLVANKQ